MTGPRVLLIVAAFFLVALGSFAGYLSVEPPKQIADASEESTNEAGERAAENTPPNAPKQKAPEAETQIEEQAYGSNWPVCRDMSNNPVTREQACLDLLKKKEVLTQKHLSWTFNNLGTAYLEMRRYDLAAKEFTRALEADPNNHAPYSNFGRIVLAFGQPKRALDFIDKAIALRPDDMGQYCQRAHVLSVLGRFDEGLATLTKAEQIGILPDCAIKTRASLTSRTLCERGRIFWKQGRQVDAFAAYQEAMRIDATNTCAVIQSAYSVLWVKPFAESTRFIDKLMADYPKLAALHCYKGYSLEMAGDLHKALASYLRAIEGDAKENCGYTYRAKFFMRMRAWKDALADFEVANQREPREVGAWIGRGDALRQLGRSDDALKSYNNALTLEKDNVAALMSRGDLNRSLQQFAVAAIDYAKVVKLDSKSGIALYRHAESSLAAGQYDAAIGSCRALAEIDTWAMNCHVIIARALLLQQKPETAVQYIDAIDVKMKEKSNADLYLIGIDLMAGNAARAEMRVKAYRATHPEDLYGVVWAALVAKGVGDAIPADISILAAKNDIWPAPLLRWLVDDDDENALLAATDTPDLILSWHRRAEGEFYLGLAAALSGDSVSRAKHYRAALKIGYVSVDEKKFPALYKYSNGLETTLAEWHLAENSQ